MVSTIRPSSGSVLRQLQYSYDSREIETHPEVSPSTDVTEEQFRKKGRFIDLAAAVMGIRHATFNPLKALEQENLELRQYIAGLARRIGMLEQRLAKLEDLAPEEKIVILREISKDQAKDEIRVLFAGGETLYYSDIAERLRLDLELVVEICNELQHEGEIAVSDDPL